MMKSKAAIPFYFGLLGLLGVGLYLCTIEAYSTPIPDISLILSFFSFFFGLIAAILTRKSRLASPALWWSGVVMCILGILLWGLLLGFLLALALALREI